MERGCWGGDGEVGYIGEVRLLWCWFGSLRVGWTYHFQGIGKSHEMMERLEVFCFERV